MAGIPLELQVEERKEGRESKKNQTKKQGLYT